MRIPDLEELFPVAAATRGTISLQSVRQERESWLQRPSRRRTTFLGQQERARRQTALTGSVLSGFAVELWDKRCRAQKRRRLQAARPASGQGCPRPDRSH